MYQVIIWDGEIEVVWNVIAADRKTAVARAKKDHFEVKGRRPLEVHSHKI